MKRPIPRSAFVLIVSLLPALAMATPILSRQVDEIVLVGAAYRGDIWTLTISGPISAEVAYVTTADDEVGSNTWNTALNWATAINSDAILAGFLSAAAAIAATPVIHLTAIQPGIAFSSMVSVIEARETDLNEDPDLSVTVSTVVPALEFGHAVSEPSTIILAVLSAVYVGRRNARRRELYRRK